MCLLLLEMGDLFVDTAVPLNKQSQVEAELYKFSKASFSHN